jgi:hypothetical protein
MRSVRSSRLRLESLEDRFNPAGTVTGSFSAGTWTLTGDAEANGIVINPTATPGAFVLAGTDTTVAGVTNPTGVNNIVIKLSAGSDSVQVNTTGAAGKLAGDLTIQGGAGPSAVEIRNFKIGKNLSVTNGANPTGFDTFYLIDSSVAGKVAILNGDGNTITVSYRNSAGFNFIGGGLTIVNGTGRDSTAMNDTHIIGDVVARNGRPDAADDAGAFGIYNDRNTTTRALIRGHVSVSYHSGEIDYDGIWDTEVTGNVTFNHGTGKSTTYFDGYKVAQPVVIRGSLTINDSGPSTIEVGTQYYKTGLFIGRGLTISTGEAADTLKLHNLTVSAATAITTGGGNDTISVDGSTFRRFQLYTGTGADVVNIDTEAGFATKFVGDALVGLGTDNDTLTIGAAGDFTRRAEFVRSASFLGGAGDDTLKLLNAELLTGLPVIAAYEAVLP